MRYWDSSALIPLIVAEPKTPVVRALMSADPDITSLRRRHLGELSMDAHELAESSFAELSETWTEMPMSAQVIATAMDVLSRHRLSEGDAVQLATALTGSSPSKLVFVTLDEALKAAARVEGFAVLP